MESVIVDKFWKFTSKTSTCWNWIGPIKRGNPVFQAPVSEQKYKEYYARRVALEIAGRQLHARTSAWCKNKLCVNPDHLTSGDEERFWSKVQKTNDCWVWTGLHDKDMYGKFHLSKDTSDKHVRAHQFSWFLFSGRWLPKNLCLCHTCDKPYCVNPSHLFIGTNKDNTQDKVNKNRQAKGTSIFASKLNDEKVKKIRELFNQGQTKTQLSNLFGVVRTTIGAIVRGKTWRHLL